MNKCIEEIVGMLAASNNPFVDVPIETMPKVAEALYNAGYRKLPEDSVVLSKEEYEDYKKHVDNCIEEYYRGQHEAEVYYKNIQVPRERKETAEKILQPLYNACKEDTYGQVVVDFAILENLAKQFGVEIKE